MLCDIRDRVLEASMRQQQMNSGVFQSNMTHEMVGSHLTSQQTVTAEESVSLRPVDRMLDCGVEQSASQHAVLQTSGTVRWYCSMVREFA